MKNLISRLKSLFGWRLFVVLLLLALSWLTGYQFGSPERTENGPSVQAGCHSGSFVKCVDKVLGDETEQSEHKPDEKKVERKPVHQEVSPDGERRIVMYEVPFTGEGDLDYRNYLNNQYFYSVEDISFTSGRETYVFVNDYKGGYPHWLDNEYIFFTSGCGTGCRGMYLVNTRTRESRQAVVFTNPLGAESFETQFHDWFGQDFKFSGWSKNIRASFLEGKAYLVFQMWNNDRPMGEKRFLFTGESLEAL